MKLSIEIEWWENEEQEYIPEDHMNILKEHAISRVNKMAGESSDGYVEGELHYEIEETYYDGYWRINA